MALNLRAYLFVWLFGGLLLVDDITESNKKGLTAIKHQHQAFSFLLVLFTGRALSYERRQLSAMSQADIELSQCNYPIGLSAAQSHLIPHHGYLG